MEERSVPQLVETITKDLLSLNEHAESLRQNPGLEEEILHILNLAEELGIKLGIIVESPTSEHSNGDSLME
jgi:hypothetical protein